MDYEQEEPEEFYGVAPTAWRPVLITDGQSVVNKRVEFTVTIALVRRLRGASESGGYSAVPRLTQDVLRTKAFANAVWVAVVEQVTELGDLNDLSGVFTFQLNANPCKLDYGIGVKRPDAHVWLSAREKVFPEIGDAFWKGRSPVKLETDRERPTNAADQTVRDEWVMRNVVSPVFLELCVGRNGTEQKPLFWIFTNPPSVAPRDVAMPVVMNPTARNIAEMIAELPAVAEDCSWLEFDENEDETHRFANAAAALLVLRQDVAVSSA